MFSIFNNRQKCLPHIKYLCMCSFAGRSTSKNVFVRMCVSPCACVFVCTQVCMSNSHEVSGTCRVHTKSNKSPSTPRRERCHREKKRRKIPIINKTSLLLNPSTSMACKCSEPEEEGIFNELTIGGWKSRYGKGNHLRHFYSIHQLA